METDGSSKLLVFFGVYIPSGGFQAGEEIAD